MIDEQEIIRRILPKVKRPISFTKEGRIILLAYMNKLPKSYHVLLYLLEKRLANLAESTDSLNTLIKELSSALEFTKNYTRALLSELLARGLIARSESGPYNMELMRLEEITRLLESKPRSHVF